VPLFETGAKMLPYDAGLRTPLILWAPGRVKPGRDARTLVSSVDLAPTLLKLASLKPPREMPGLDLRERARLRSRNAAFGATFTHNIVDLGNPASSLKYRWIASGKWKLILPAQKNLELPLWPSQMKNPGTGWSREIELYDLSADPHETANVASKNPGVVSRLRRQLDAWWRGAD